MFLRIAIYFICFIGVVACNSLGNQPLQPKTIIPAFYYWKSDFRVNQDFLDTLKIKKLYVKFFDVTYNSLRGAVPVDLLGGGLSYFPNNEALNKMYRDEIKDFPDSAKFEIVPTVFITNHTLKQLTKDEVIDLAQKINKKITDYAKFEEGQNVWHPKILREIQIDCDWTQGTQTNYFLLLQELKHENPHLKLSATIRLWQYKHRKLAGIPPVDRGLLMCYNLTDLREPTTKNSIFNRDEILPYLDTDEKYPIPLDFALPIFNWGVVFRNNTYIDLLKDFNSLKAKELAYLTKQQDNLFMVNTDTVIGYLYLREGDQIRIEDVAEKDLLQLCEDLKTAVNTDTVTISLFHLDSELTKKYSYETFKKIYTSLY